MAISTTAPFVSAVPVPMPTPVAVNTVPTTLSAEPTKVKSVVPTVLIVYVEPTTNAPAVIVITGMFLIAKSSSICKPFNGVVSVSKYV